MKISIENTETDIYYLFLPGKMSSGHAKKPVDNSTNVNESEGIFGDIVPMDSATSLNRDIRIYRCT
jgi:hypothetical protein